MLPGFAFIARRQARVQGNKKTAAALNVRPLERYSAQEAPDPIRQGDTPARPSRMPIAIFQSFASIRAVMRDDFLVALWAPSPHAQTLSGPQGAWQERTNVHKPAAEAYGSLVVVNPTDVTPPLWP